MHIEIENPNKTTRSFTDSNNRTWHVAEQDALLFKSDSKYPDKFTLTLSFTQTESDATNAKPHPVGKYIFDESAYYINRRGQCVLEPSRLHPVKQELKQAS